MSNEDLHHKLNTILTALRSELSSLRTGRANASLVENVKVEAYEGTPPLMIKELAAINTPEPRLIVIDPYDKAVLPKIEKALQTTPSLGVSPVVSEGIIRLPLPPLSQERRQEAVRLVKKMLEKTRQELRDIRQAAIREVEEEKKSGAISEDEMFSQKREIEAAVKKVHGQMERLGKEKEEEILLISH